MNIKQSKRRYPGSKTRKVLYAKFDHIDEKLDYISSRKLVYVPEYFNMIKNKNQTCIWKKYVDNGNNIVVCDFDGPRMNNGEPICLPITKKLLKEKINDSSRPFGHGYVIAGFKPEDYIE